MSELAAKIKAGEVKEIAVEGDSLAVKMADGKELVSKKEAEAGITETLKNYGLTEENLNAINLSIKTPSGFIFWASAILPFLAPFLLVILLMFPYRQQMKYILIY